MFLGTRKWTAAVLFTILSGSLKIANNSGENIWISTLSFWNTYGLTPSISVVKVLPVASILPHCSFTRM